MPPSEFHEQIAALAEAHGTTFAMLRPIFYAIERTIPRGHNLSRYLSMLLDLGVITADQSREISETYRAQFAADLISADHTIALFHQIVFRGIDN